MIQANDDLRIGIRYLTETKLSFKPSVTTKVVSPGATAALAVLGGLDLGLYMPQALNVAAFYQLDEKWAILADFGWEDWSCFGKLDVGFGRTGQLGVADLETKDVYHYGIGTQYQFDESLMLSAGFSFDSQLSPNDKRPLVLPLKDMYRYGAGFEKELSEDFTLGAGLDLVWEGDVLVQATDAGASVIHGQYTSVYFVFASVYGVWKF